MEKSPEITDIFSAAVEEARAKALREMEEHPAILLLENYEENEVFTETSSLFLGLPPEERVRRLEETALPEETAKILMEISAAHEKLEELSLLFGKYPNLENFHQDLLNLAVSCGKLEAVKFLVLRGADPLRVSEKHFPCLCLRKNGLEIINFLIDTGYVITPEMDEEILSVSKKYDNRKIAPEEKTDE